MGVFLVKNSMVCGLEEPQIVIISEHKENGCYAFYAGYKRNISERSTQTLAGWPYIELTNVHNTSEVQREMDLLNSSNLQRPLMRKSGVMLMSKDSFEKWVDKAVSAAKDTPAKNLEFQLVS